MSSSPMPSSKKPSRRSLTTLSPLKLLLLLPLLFSPALSASSNVPIDDPVYRDIDKLVGAGLVKDVIYGQRPWSRREIARIIATAKKNEKENPLLVIPDDQEIELNILIEDILERLTYEYREELAENDDLEGDLKDFFLKPLEQVGLNYTLLDSPTRLVPVTNRLGDIDAVMNPMVAYQNGHRIVNGHSLGVETIHWGRFSKYFSLYARPRFELTSPWNRNTEASVYAQQLYVNFVYKKLSIDVGRDALIWGQGEHGGLAFSDNARALDQIKISNDTPFFFPGFLKYLGPSKLTLFIANLGPKREFKNSFLYGVKGSIKPTSWFELGMSHTLIMGGQGAPEIKPFDPIQEFFFLRRGGARGEGVQVADHRFGADLRIFLPQIRNTQFYFDALWDDIGRETLVANFTEQMAFTSGIYAPHLTVDGRIALILEYTRVPPVVYRHSTWTSGYALNQLPLGNASCFDCKEIKVTMRNFFEGNKSLSTRFTYMTSSNNTYDQTISSKGGPDRVLTLTTSPKESRFGLISSYEFPLTEKMLNRITLGYERVENFSFDTETDIHNFILSLSMTYRL